MKRAWVGPLTGMVAVLMAVFVMTYTSTAGAQKSADDGVKKKVTRLPNYYAKVSTEEQKEQLRAIVQEYAPKIQQKREELQALVAERNAALDKVLTPEQRKELGKLREAAAADREANDNAAGSASGKSKAKSKSKKAA